MTGRILIVDDVPANARLLEAKLSSEYYLVRSAGNGFEALHTARNWQPDLVLLDVMMPGMDGYECCRRLKTQVDTLHIPIVMITALGESSARLRGIEAGADDFLTKPVDYDTLLARVRSLIRLKRLLDEWRARAETAQALGLGGDQTVAPSINGARVLVIDDWEHNSRAISCGIVYEGLVTDYVNDTDAAFMILGYSSFDLVVVSLSLANEDPLKFISAVRASNLSHETPILVLADPDEKDRLIRAFELGANDWLLHPFDQYELRARIRNQIQRKLYQGRLRSDIGTALEFALTDPLTGLYNQRYLRRHLNGLMEADQNRQLAILMIDVDHFKLVNDHFGHIVGDRALRVIADILRINTRVFDSIARYGGEEFVVVMPSTNFDEAIKEGDRLRSAVESMDFRVSDDKTLSLTVSVGIACSSDVIRSSEILLQTADAALYLAKRNGRNRTEVAKVSLAS